MRPKRSWQFGERDGLNHYTLRLYSLTYWEFSDGHLGWWARTPWTAVWRWHRGRKIAERIKEER